MTINEGYCIICFTSKYPRDMGFKCYQQHKICIRCKAGQIKCPICRCKNKTRCCKLIDIFNIFLF